MHYYLPTEEQATQLSVLFALLLPVGGAIGIGPIGLLLDHGGLLLTSLVILVMGITYGMLGMLHSYPAQVVSMFILVILRPLMYTYVGDYCGK
jgi:hypothetical protein